MDIHHRLTALQLDDELRISLRVCFESVMLLSPPADGLLLISDTRLPECPVGLFQAEGDCPLQVIFIISGQIDHICKKETHHMLTGGNWDCMNTTLTFKV